MAQKPRPCVVAIAGAANVRTIGDCHRNLLSALQQKQPVRLDLKQLDDADLTLVQLVESARRFAATRHGDFTLAAPAEGALLEMLTRGGFLAGAADRAFWLQTGEAK